MIYRISIRSGRALEENAIDDRSWSVSRITLNTRRPYPQRGQAESMGNYGSNAGDASLRGIGSTSMDLEVSSRGSLHRLVPASRLTSPTLEGDCFLNRGPLDRGKPCQPPLARERVERGFLSRNRAGTWQLLGFSKEKPTRADVACVNAGF